MYTTFAEYRQAWSNADRVDPPMPLNVDIELASVCNLECPFCFIADKSFDTMIRQKSSDGRSKRRIMPRDLALKIIDESARLGVPALKMNWRGESTIHPDYSDILEYAGNSVRSFHEILVNTNANCPEKSLDGLMAATKVMVSLDSLVPEIYAKMRAGGSLEKAKEIIKELICRKHPNLWIRRVLTQDNKKEPFLEMVRQEFGLSPKVSEHYCYDRNSQSNHEQSGCEHDNGMARIYCNYPSQRVVVASTGLCYPCCIDLHETMPIGDITKQSLNDIWVGNNMVNLRQQLRNNHYVSEACKNCQSWMSYKAPQRQYVQDIEIK